MNLFLFILLIFIFILPFESAVQREEGKGLHLGGYALAASVKNSPELSPHEDSEDEKFNSIEEYEKEKLARLKRNIGKRFLAIKTVHPPEFYESSDNLMKKISLREKEEFLITDVVQNPSGTMNFYKVRLEAGKVGYLIADGHNLEIRIKDGSVISMTKSVGKKKLSQEAKKKEWGLSKDQASKAVEWVKNHPTWVDPITGEGKSVEKRMTDLKERSFPNMKWNYEARGIGNNQYRVTQYSENEERTSIFKTWIVDFSTGRINPENLAAKKMYRLSN